MEASFILWLKLTTISKHEAPLDVASVLFSMGCMPICIFYKIFLVFPL